MERREWCLPLLCLTAAGFGWMLIYSATRYDTALHGLPMKQAGALLAGLFVCLLARSLDWERWTGRLWWLFASGSAVLLLLLIPFGNDNGTGNRSWLALPVVNIQPAELVKVVFVLLLARQIQGQKAARTWGSLPSVIRLALHGGLVVGLLWLTSGDMGMVTVYLLVYFVMLFGAGLPLRWLFMEAGAGVLGLVFLWRFLPDYIRMRVLVVWNHELDPFGKGFQQGRSLLAIGSGQFTGQGYLQGMQTQSVSASALPARHTDLIFSVAGEELGLMGCLCILLLLGGIVLRCLWLAARQGPGFGRWVCLGTAGMFGVQTLLNVAMCLYAAPVIGVTLPFFSYGGSSLVSGFFAVGLVCQAFSR